MNEVIEIPCKYGTLVAESHYFPGEGHSVGISLRRADGDVMKCAVLEAPFEGDHANLSVFHDNSQIGEIPVV